MWTSRWTSLEIQMRGTIIVKAQVAADNAATPSQTWPQAR
jgi:hypothetical protein